MITASIESVAAVDLGSNSFHMIVAQVLPEGRLQIIDRLKETVRLAEGLDNQGRLNEVVAQRALACLERFGQRLRGFAVGKVKAVGTNTLRRARNRSDFLKRAEKALGHPIDVIAGREEARLIYLGVSHSIESGGERRLVMDIGGGSTELILGQQFQPEYMDSLHIGCVGMTGHFFRNGKIDAERMRSAEITAMQELETLIARYQHIGWGAAIGASGTILAIAETITQQGWAPAGQITAAGLGKLRKALINAGNSGALSQLGLPEDRIQVFPGGFAILSAAFEALGITLMQTSGGALREGLLYELLGRIHHEDVREGTVSDLIKRYRLDYEQAKRVAETAQLLLAQAPNKWQVGGEEYKNLLRWAAYLHEIGLSIAYSQYQKHGAYLAKYLDLPGFSQREQEQLAALIRSHRRKFPIAELGIVPMPVFYLCLLLRLAVVLHRSRAAIVLPSIRLQADADTIELLFPAGWLEEHPLTLADLEQEADFLKPARIRLKFGGSGGKKKR